MSRRTCTLAGMLYCLVAPAAGSSFVPPNSTKCCSAYVFLEMEVGICQECWIQIMFWGVTSRYCQHGAIFLKNQR